MLVVRDREHAVGRETDPLAAPVLKENVASGRRLVARPTFEKRRGWRPKPHRQSRAHPFDMNQMNPKPVYQKLVVKRFEVITDYVGVGNAGGQGPAAPEQLDTWARQRHQRFGPTTATESSLGQMNMSGSPQRVQAPAKGSVVSPKQDLELAHRQHPILGDG